MRGSRIPTFSIKPVIVRVKPDWILPTLIFVGMFVAALSSEPWYTLLAVGVVYLASLPVGWWQAYQLRRRHERANAAIAPGPTGPGRVVSLGWSRRDPQPPKPDQG
jgi:CDP-diacylglycerol--serine O-phosphatidyltransferase